MHVGKKIQIVVIIMQLLVNIVLREMEHLGVMVTALGLLTNVLKLQLLEMSSS